MSQYETLTRATISVPSAAKFSIKKVGKTDGYDGHCLRAYHYFPDQFTGIPETVFDINATENTHPTWRQDGKPVTFALTYLGTWKTLVNNCGFTEPMARSIEANYIELYKVSAHWKAQKIDQVSKCGYATVAFGLRVRAPLLHQVILGNRKTPYEAEAEARTIGNAFGQSYGLLNTVACTKVMHAVRNSKYRLDIRVCAQIHDAMYFLIRDNLEALVYLNKLVGDAMAWDDLPEIKCEGVPLSGQLDIFYPTWNDGFTIHNDATVDDVITASKQSLIKRKEKRDAQTIS